MFTSNGSVTNEGIWTNGEFVRSAKVEGANFTNQTEREYKSSHILVESAAEAAYLYQELQATQGSKIIKFRDLAKRFSKDPGSGKNGGQLGWASKGTFVPEYERVAAGLKVDDISMPFSTQFGWHLIYLEDKVELTQLTAFNNAQQIETMSALPVSADKDLMVAEVEFERKKRQELEEQLRVIQQRPVNSQTIVAPSIGKRIALVVGNANYKLRPLKNSRNDADDVSRSLKMTGFEVIDLRDATLSQMRTAVRQFGDRLINNDVGLVYYSGHGVEVKGRNYFIPVNADIQREDEIADQGFDVALILEKMSTAGKGVNILIVDACRDDPFGRSFRSSSRGLANMDAPRGTIIAYATSPGKVASDGDPRERNSPYTKHLIKAMQSPNKPIEQVFKEVRRAVQDETKNQQTPWENTSLSGDFFFKVQR
jgi:hypothetical protein